MTPPPKDIMQEKIVTVLWNKRGVKDSKKPGSVPSPSFSSNRAELPPVARVRPWKHGIGIQIFQVYQPGEVRLG